MLGSILLFFLLVSAGRNADMFAGAQQPLGPWRQPHDWEGWNYKKEDTSFPGVHGVAIYALAFLGQDLFVWEKNKLFSKPFYLGLLFLKLVAKPNGSHLEHIFGNPFQFPKTGLEAPSSVLPHALDVPLLEHFPVILFYIKHYLRTRTMSYSFIPEL